MHISGLVVAFEPEVDVIQSAMAAIQQAGPFTVGELAGQRLSVVMEVAAPEESLQWHRWLSELPGVLDVHVAYVSVADHEPEGMARGAQS
jgi:nitrate reductase NapAB chaperone NapD